MLFTSLCPGSLSRSLSHAAFLQISKWLASVLLLCCRSKRRGATAVEELSSDDDELEFERYGGLHAAEERTARQAAVAEAAARQAAAAQEAAEGRHASCLSMCGCQSMHRTKRMAGDGLMQSHVVSLPAQRDAEVHACSRITLLGLTYMPEHVTKVIMEQGYKSLLSDAQCCCVHRWCSA